MIGYSTGLRGIRTPYLNQDHLDEETDLLMLSDKNTPDNYHSRWVWIPPKLRQQIGHYEQYLKRFNESNVTYRARDGLFEPDPAWNNPLLFVSESLQALEVSPSTIRDTAGDLFPGASNHNRHWLRTHLIEKDVFPEAVDQFMGHWSLGEEPFGNYSTTCPEYLIRPIKPVILDALDDLGFELLNPTLNHKRVTL
jgi:hypothetical protein